MYANVLCESQRGIAFVAFAKFIHPPRSLFDRHISTSHWNSWGGKALGVPQLELACSSSPRPAFQMLGMCSKYSLLYTKHLSAFFMVRFSDLSPSGHSSLVCQGPSYSVRFTICKIALWQTLGWFHWTQLEPWEHCHSVLLFPTWPGRGWLTESHHRNDGCQSKRSLWNWKLFKQQLEWFLFLKVWNVLKIWKSIMCNTLWKVEEM